MGASKFFDIEETGFDYAKERDEFVKNLDMIREMSVEEATLYKKWVECQPYRDKYDASLVTKSKIWVPSNLQDKEKTLSELRALKPVIKYASSEYDISQWLNLRIFCHTMEFDMTPGRMLRFLIYDEITEKYLGAVSLSSDVTTISDRDSYIGWTKEDKFEKGKLNNTSIASCIMSTQPFGYNFLGGKLVAALLSTKYIRDIWRQEYNDELVGITTTSLYGPESMYNGIPYWKHLGVSAGRIYLKPDDKHYKIWHQWIQENKPVDYARITEKTNDTAGPVTGIKQRILNMIFKQVGIKPTHYMHGYQRGIYFAPFYENFKDFLTSKIDEKSLILKERLKTDREGVLAWWLPKAEARFTKLFDEKRVKPEILYYNKLAFMSWEDTRKQYLHEVGR